MKVYRALTSFVLICLSGLYISAIEPYKFTIDGLFQKNYVASPEASAIKYEFVHPVNYSTGQVDIKIPLFNIECGSLTLPIYLSYNTSGIKINEPCSWVGQNWTLHAEPVVSRVVKGHLDCGWKSDVNKEHDSYFWARKYLNNNFYSRIDAMPDEYYYSFLSDGGMFMYGKKTEDSKDGEFVSIPYNDVKIHSPRHIVAPDGTTYLYYGATDKANQPAIYETAWHASKVIAANGVDSIDFSYGNTTGYSIRRHEDHITVVDKIRNQRIMRDGWYTDRIEATIQLQNPSIINGVPCNFIIDPEIILQAPIVYFTKDDITNSYLYKNDKLVSDNGLIEKQLYYPDNQITTQHISHIRYKNNDAEFITDIYDKNLLREIIVRNYLGNEVKRIRFDYATYNYGNSVRNYLEKISISSVGNDISEEYHFEYNNFDIPACGTRDFDFWGYYNGAYTENEQTIVPNMKLYTTIPSKVRGEEVAEDSLQIGCPMKRGSNEKFMKNGMLKCITYPTGAKQTFIFEANKARLQNAISTCGYSSFRISDQLYGNNGIYQLGGLRIKEILIEDSTGILQRRSFVYGEKEDGAGTTPIMDGINYFIREQRKIYYTDLLKYSSYPQITSRYRTLSSTPVIPIAYYNGASVMYKKVTEYNGTKDSHAYKTIYKYDIPEYKALYLTNLDLWDTSTNYSSWHQDNLSSKEIFEKNGNDYVLKQSDAYEYSYVNMNGYNVFGRQYRLDTYECYSEQERTMLNEPLEYQKQDYSEKINTNLITKNVHKEYCCNGAITTQTTYSYGKNDVQLREIAMKRGGFGSYLTSERYVHPQDMGELEPYSSMATKNMLSPVVKATYSHNGIPNLEKNEIYDIVNGTMILPVEFSYKTPEMNEAYVKNTCKYDKNGNPILVTENGLAKGIVWDESGQNILAIVETCKDDTTTDFNNFIKECESLLRLPLNTTASGEKQSSVIKELPADFLENCGYNVTSFGYDEYDRLAYIKKPNGQTYYYKYDGLHRLVEVQNTSKMILERYVYHNKNIK